jgi:hypothetical protein
MVQTAQRRQALGEVEARHREILRLEADIRVNWHKRKLLKAYESLCGSSTGEKFFHPFAEFIY